MKFMAVIEVDGSKLATARGGIDGPTRHAVEEEFGWLAESGISVRLLEDDESFVIRPNSVPKLSDIKIIGPILDMDKLVLGRIELATDGRDGQ